MSTYQRSDLPFPVGADSLMKLVDPLTGSPLTGVLTNLPGLALAIYNSNGSEVSLDLGDGTTLNIHGAWAFTGNPVIPQGIVGQFDDLERVLTGTDNVLETVNDFSVSFSESLSSLQITSYDFSQIASLYEGDDRLYGGALGDLLKGFDGNDTNLGHGGPDTLFGGKGNDELFGGGGRDRLSGGSGVDTLVGNHGDDILVGGRGSDVLNGNSGNDSLIGTAGADTLNGGNDDDRLSGGDGDDALSGGAGRDVLIGGAGGDRLSGGGAADTFVFSGNFNHDTISDFAGSNLEKIDLSGVAAITGFADLINHHLFDDPGGSGFALIDDGSGHTILLEGIAVSDIGVGQTYSGADFIF